MIVNDGEHEFEEWLELNNGCLCCTVKDSGVEAIEKLMKRKGKFDWILLETSGIADPGPIAKIFWMDEGLGSDLYLDGIVTVLDASNIIKSLNDTSNSELVYHGAIENEPISTASIQVALADVIILNKIDKVSPEELVKVREKVTEINSLASMIETSYSKISMDSIFDVKAYETEFKFDEKKFHTHGWHNNVSTSIFHFFQVF